MRCGPSCFSLAEAIDYRLQRVKFGSSSEQRTYCAEEIVLGGGELILLVDDNDMVRDSTRNLLEVLGYTVMEAKSGSEAVQLIEAGAGVSLVLCDVVMPGMSGFDFAEWIQENRPGLKVLLTSGYHDPDRLEGDRSSLRRIKVLGKPYKLEQLEQSIEEVLAAGQT